MWGVATTERRATRSCRCGIYVGRAQLSWPFGRLDAAPAAARTAPLSRSGLWPEQRLDPSTVKALRRNGVLFQWGVIAERDDGVIGLWGPRVLRVLGAVDGLPKVTRDARELLWRSKLWRPGSAHV